MCITWEIVKRGCPLKEVKVRERVEKALDKIRVYLQADGGDVELVEVTDDGEVKVKLKGVCLHCPMSIITIKQGIERFLKKEVPEVKEVIPVD